MLKVKLMKGKIVNETAKSTNISNTAIFVEGMLSVS
jgi:hypothetical protein